MIKKFIKNKSGLTLIEIIVVIFIVGVITTVFVYGIRIDDDQKLDLAADQLVADIRHARNLAVSRTVVDFEDGNDPVYPPGGYVMEFWPSDYFYFIYAEKGTGPGYHVGIDKKIKKVYLPDSDWWFNDANNDDPHEPDFIRVTFFPENKITTSLSASSTNSDFGYGIQITNPKGQSHLLRGYKQVIKMAEDSNDGTITLNIGLPTPGSIKWPKYRPVEMVPPVGGMGR
jgi:prepilin-type N-terminal cleavage/methylation domain-containing protein